MSLNLMEDIDPVLLKRYVSGDCSEAESKVVQRWLENQDLNIDSTVFDGIDRLELKQEIWDATEYEKTVKRKNRVLLYAYKIAACLAIFYFAGYAGYQFYTSTKQATPVKSSNHDLVVLPGRKVTVTLSDGTVVQLNGDSKLNYPLNFPEQGQREVFLSGEAYFRVAKDASRPFIIHAAGTATRVLGTVFNLKAYQEQNGAILTVEEGKVRFSADGNTKDHLILTAGKQAVYKAGHGLKLGEVSADEVVAWKDSKMIIRKLTLQEISLLITRWYGTKVEIKDSRLANERFTGIYNNTALETLAKDISLIFHCNYKLDQQTLIFY